MQIMMRSYLLTYLCLIETSISVVINTCQGRQRRVGRVGNCPPRFWQNRRWRAALLLARPALGSYILTPLHVVRTIEVLEE